MSDPAAPDAEIDDDPWGPIDTGKWAVKPLPEFAPTVKVERRFDPLELRDLTRLAAKPHQRLAGKPVRFFPIVKLTPDDK